MVENSGERSQARQIDVLAVIDTAYLRHAYGANEDSARPRRIPREGQFMVSTGSRADGGQGTGKLRLQMKVGDRVTIRVTSICGNANDAVIPYRVLTSSGTQVLDRFEQVFLLREGAVQPDPDSAAHNGLPPLERHAHFSSFNSTVIARGAERLEIAFVLYVLSSNGQRQDPFGYYAWSPSITIT